MNDENVPLPPVIPLPAPPFFQSLEGPSKCHFNYHFAVELQVYQYSKEATYPFNRRYQGSPMGQPLSLPLKYHHKQARPIPDLTEFTSLTLSVRVSFLTC